MQMYTSAASRKPIQCNRIRVSSEASNIILDPFKGEDLILHSIVAGYYFILCTQKACNGRAAIVYA